MRQPPPRRRIAATVLSVAVNVALLATLTARVPALRLPPEARGPPEPVIPILIMPRTPPPAAQPGAPPQPIRLHRRRQRFAPEDTQVAPLVVPTAPPPPVAPTPAPKPRAPTERDAIASNAQRALRGALGCANAAVLGLSREEREKCDQALAAGARQAEFSGLGLNAGKAGELARAAARREADYRNRRANLPVGTPTLGGDASQPWRVNIPPTAGEQSRLPPDR